MVDVIDDVYLRGDTADPHKPDGDLMRTPSGHVYEMGTWHDCGVSDCPANAPRERTDRDEETEPPSRAISGLLWEYGQQMNAASTHMAAEGVEIKGLTVLESYDRVLHPWMHGRRPHEIYERIRGWFA
ncbi:hypothetical protein [Halocalculus aciditolerans]|uniref:Uncharacterized protein n=1 Tax=Halocalculus aciditolerans TaxID=1383812 RepID=A0A830FA69_9EURY|nr:hypothetical protein [Halocalculus aciditolerans]GGL55041.1 hypothetical protein GCM10009039_11410 [Halocalculus aciditolerans]